MKNHEIEVSNAMSPHSRFRSTLTQLHIAPKEPTELSSAFDISPDQRLTATPDLKLKPGKSFMGLNL